MADLDAPSLVRIETVETDGHGSRQISNRTRRSAPLAERADEVREAIQQATVLAQDSLAQVPERHGWAVRSVQVTFGLTLAAEAGVILSKASAEASLEVTLTVERADGAP
ncbi:MULTISPECIES: CU044_2847 family protein [unclassified Streptomyces]|uniref:CU044_2847 family protein n=1 Tax=unclassified Streptomyces TaxID=2593676 RepID=UPI0023673D5E|nr:MULTISPECIES: CU044_2847 family protein [unclassified Streptomyces]MDF3144206.1 CU044_2847 family protein [Streptomyces sp. T21Q-yed]WDF43659.1 CU044_2847 family protein [Streptomyces sp. T12]